MNCVIRVDASSEIGVGHVMRCLTLAIRLRELKVSAVFVMRNHPGSMIDHVISNGFKVHALPDSLNNIDSSLSGYEKWLGVKQEFDADCTKEIISNQFDVLVVDHYGIDYKWESQLRSCVNKVVVIDDLSNRRHDCDLLLDMTLGRKKSDYFNKAPEKCKILTGAKYTILRKQFLDYRNKAIAKRQSVKQVESILISFGGTDPANATLWVLECLTLMGINAEINVVLGEGAIHKERIQEYIASNHNMRIKLHFQVKNMAKLMFEADLAVGSGGTTSWERCCLGLPAVVIPTEDNQTLVAENLHKVGAIINLGMFDKISVGNFTKRIASLISNAHNMKIMSDIAQSVCDGRGVDRFSEAILKRVSLRLASYKDCEILFKWVNEPDVRVNAVNRKSISWEEHEAWFVGALDAQSITIFIVELLGVPIGQVRFDFKDLYHEIDYFIDSNYRGKELGREALLSAIGSIQSENAARFKAVVREENIASYKVLTSLGFKDCGFAGEGIIKLELV